jgi:CRP/FNR family transcriptional regulator
MLEAPTRERLRAAYPALSRLPGAAFETLCAGASVLRPARGEVVFNQRSPCRAFPLLLEGAIRVARVTGSGREILLYRVAPGEACVLTSSCLLGRQDYGARGSAESDCVLVALSQPAFDALVAEHAAFREYIFGLFGERMRELMELVDAVAFQRLDQRLAGLLLGKGATLRATHQQLADELGSVREIVSRMLSHFADDGLVALGRERIEVLDAAGLRKIAAGAL